MSDTRPRAGRTSKTLPFARHGRLPRFSPVKTATKIVAGALGVALVSTGSIVAIAGGMLVDAAQDSVDLDPIANGQQSAAVASAAPQISAIEGGANILLVGSDQRAGQGGGYGDEDEETAVLNDVNMLMHISEDHKNVTVVSFPRDMFVDIPACVDTQTGDALSPSYDVKINSALQQGGLACVASTIENLTGLDIPYAATVQFNGVIEMSNAIGGVDVCVATEISDPYYTGLELEPGMHTLQGAQALAFLRTRHGVGDGSDLTRISNQQVFLSALVRKVKSAETLSSPVALYGLARAALSNLTLSTSMNNVDTMVQLGLALQDVNLEDVVFVQYPTGAVDGGVIPDEEAALVLNTALQADQPLVLTGTTGNGATLDPSLETEAPVATDPAVPDGTVPDPAATDPAVVDPSTTPTTTPGVVALPENVTGQNAGEQTCSVGYFG